MTRGQSRILYANQTAQMSGAERSLLDLLAGLPGEVEPIVACPRGDFDDVLRQRGFSTVFLPATDVSFRLHPVHTLRGAAWLVRAGWRLRTLGRRLDAALVHANSTRAGLAACAAARAGGKPAIVHVRDWVPSGRVAAATLRAIEIGASAVIANSRYVAGQLPRGGGGTPVRVIHNPVDTARFDPERVDRKRGRARLGLAEGELAMGVVAQLTPWKGQDDAIRVLALLKPAHPRLRLVLAGSAKFTAPSARFDNAGYATGLHRLVTELGLEREVLFVGERDDVPEVLAAIDLLLVPSWREALGRIVLEGMAMRLPGVVTNVGGPVEIVRDGVDGRTLSPRDPALWARTVDQLLSRPDLRAEMGARGRERVSREFSVDRHVREVAAVYDEVLAAQQSHR